MLIVRVGEMGIEDKSSIDRIPQMEIFKVQFISTCKTKFENEILVAFYLGEGSELIGHVLSGLPLNYQSSRDQMYLIDYKSYLDICELTNEIKMSFPEYFNEVISGSIGINTLITYNKQFLNYNSQKDLWKNLDEANN